MAGGRSREEKERRRKKKEEGEEGERRGRRKEKGEEGERRRRTNFEISHLMTTCIRLYIYTSCWEQESYEKQRVAIVSDWAILDKAQTRYSPMGLRQDHRIKSSKSASG